MSRLGPLRAALVLAPDFDAALAVYRRDLGLACGAVARLDIAQAAAFALPTLAGHRHCRLSSGNGQDWLHVVDAPGAVRRSPLTRHGWMALEVLVADPDALVARLGPEWTVLGAPANLELSPAIRAAQVLGPSGELYYFTAIKAEVPPFALPLSANEVDGPFVAVLGCADRNASCAAWESLTGVEAWRFETRVTVLNRALGRAPDTRTPLAVLQLAGRCLIEIDEVAGIDTPPIAGLEAGLHLIEISGDGTRSGLWTGPSGERVCLVDA